MFHIGLTTLLVMPDKVGLLSLNFGVDFRLLDFFTCINFAARIINHSHKPVPSEALPHREMGFCYRDVEIVGGLIDCLGTLGLAQTARNSLIYSVLYLVTLCLPNVY